MKRRGIVTAALVAVAAMMLSGCTAATPIDYSYVDVAKDPQFPAGSTMARIASSGHIRVGVAFDKPYFGLRGLNGEMQGFDIEMARIVAGKLGVKPENIDFVEAVSANREPFIEQGKVDLIIATYTINAKRKNVISFAGPYLVAGQALLIGAKTPKSVTGIDTAAGSRVCGVTGSTGYENVRENYPDVAANLVGFDTYSKCGAALENGQVDAVTADNTTLAGLVSKHPGAGFKVVGGTFSVEPYGIGLNHDDAAFRSFLNDVIEDAVADGSWKAAWDRTAGNVLTDTPQPPKVERY